MLKKYTSIVIFVIACLLAVEAHSQNATTSTISWSSVKTFDTGKGIVNEVPTTLTISSSKIDWADSKGTIIQSFTVSEIKGTWNDVTQTGEITYILGNESSGAVSISKSDQETVAHLVLTSEASSTTIDLYLDGFTLLN